MAEQHTAWQQAITQALATIAPAWPLDSLVASSPYWGLREHASSRPPTRCARWPDSPLAPGAQRISGGLAARRHHRQCAGSRTDGKQAGSRAQPPGWTARLRLSICRWRRGCWPPGSARQQVRWPHNPGAMSSSSKSASIAPPASTVTRPTGTSSMTAASMPPGWRRCVIRMA